MIDRKQMPEWVGNPTWDGWLRNSMRDIRKEIAGTMQRVERVSKRPQFVREELVLALVMSALGRARELLGEIEQREAVEPDARSSAK